MLPALRTKRRPRLRGQSLVEFALVAPLLLLLLAGGTDLARSFYIGVDVTNSLREGALFAGKHGNEAANAAVLDQRIRAILDKEEQGSFVPLRCPSWSSPPTAAQVSITESGGSIPNTTPHSATTVTITSTCVVTPWVTYFPITTRLSTTVQALVVGPAQ